MATYSGTADVKDPLLQSVAKESDHQEAEREINRELRRINVDPEADIDDEEVLKEMSVAYACMVRCKYEMQESGDAFEIRLQEFKEQYNGILKKLDSKYAKGEVSSGGGAYSTLAVVRGG